MSTLDLDHRASLVWELLEWLDRLNEETYPAYLDWLRGLDDEQFELVGGLLGLAPETPDTADLEADAHQQPHEEGARA